jgi:hypothetical protein
MIGGLSGLAVALITAVTLILTAGSAPALAGWNPVPTHPANAGQTGAALRSCDLGTPVLVDTRGPYTAAVYPTAAGASVCLTGAAIHAVGSAQSISNAHGPQARAVQVYNYTFASGNTEETVVYGRVGSAVQGVELVLNHGPNVQATVSQGWYLAWWPGHLHTTAVVVDSDHGNAQTPLRGIGPSGKCPPGAGCFSFSPDPPMRPGGDRIWAMNGW